ncbi:MAG: PEP-CTERM sorting domain-containing protein [Methyloprofundus sp.]|nr:PEP-CTERM sorting domain-containing protein [Methyloprofundus sp.]
MKIKPLHYCITALLLASGANAQASTISAITLVTDNGQWATLPTGFVNFTSGLGTDTPGNYDGFTLTVTGSAGESIDSVLLDIAFDGLFDDSIGIDLNGDGTIDFAADYFDTRDTPGIENYKPWLNLSDVQNTIVTITIGATGSSASLSVYGTDFIAGSNADSASFDNLSTITLQDLGFELGGLLPNSGSVTTSEIRFGYLNTKLGGSGTPNITSESFSSPSVPEPSSYALIGLGLTLLASKKRRSKKSSGIAV